MNVTECAQREIANAVLEMIIPNIVVLLECRGRENRIYMKAPEMPTILTIVHSNRTWKAFLDFMRANRVKRVIDLRSIPRSR